MEGVNLPVHTLAITALGIDILDNQDLEAVAETAASLKRWEFTAHGRARAGHGRHGISGKRAGDLRA